MFDNAKPLQPPTAAKRGKSAREQVELPGLAQLAQLDTVLKLVSDEKTHLTRELSKPALEVFLAQMRANPGTVPDTFTGLDGAASATISLRRRPGTSVLSEDECQQLAQAGISYGTEVVTPELFAINPVYAGDSKLLRNVQKALKDVVPADFIVRQEKLVKHVVTAETLQQVAHAPSSNLLLLCTVLQFKLSLPSWKPNDLVLALKRVLAALVKH